MSVVTEDSLASPAYRAQLLKMREEKMPRWGNGGQRHITAVAEIADQLQATSVLDYGCGHGMLLEGLAACRPSLRLAGYDPGIPARAALPEPADLLVSTDVLEHVEPEKLLGVLTHMRFLAGKAAYINVHTGPARAVLPDGRNAHLIQKPAAWWHAELAKYFGRVDRVLGFNNLRPSFLCV